MDGVLEFNVEEHAAYLGISRAATPNFDELLDMRLAPPIRCLTPVFGE